MGNDKEQGDWNGLIPPDCMIKAVGSENGVEDFKKTGEEFLCHFKNLGNLKPNETVLDVGCGCGRMARPLTEYLGERGSYEGFDKNRCMIDGCREAYRSRYQDFHFEWASVYDSEFNPTGCEACEYKFPYADEFFDFVFLTSVFTHMFPPGMTNYLSQIARVLKKNGRCLITFFIINEESLGFIRAGKAGDFNFKDSGKGYWHIENGKPEPIIAYREEDIRRYYVKCRLDMQELIRYGSWCGRESLLDSQDVVVATKGGLSRHIGGFPRVE